MNNFQKYLEQVYNEDSRKLLPQTFKQFLKEFFNNDFEDFIDYNNIDIEDYIDMFPNADDPEKEAKRDLLSDVTERFKKFYSKYKSLKFPLKLYRSISLPAKSTEDIANITNKDFIKENMGVYWSNDYKYAISHWGGQHKTQDFVLQALVDEETIDWKTTLSQNMNFWVGEEEQEITLYPGRVIEILSIKDVKSNKNTPINIKVRT